MRRRDNVTRPAQPAQLVTAEHLEAGLEETRRVAAVRRSHELACRTAEAEHGRNLADVGERSRRADRERSIREDDADAAAELAIELRQLRSAGIRIKARSDMARSGEYRANRLEQLRNLNLKVLVPVLLGFAAWSTTGVHDGAGRLMAVKDYHNPMWWALWILEPVLIGAVVWVTIVRARLASSGGKIAARAEQVAYACLSVSVFLNLVDGVPHGHSDKWLHSWPAWVAMFAAMLAHIVGPAGAAGTAHLIGLVDESIAKADPWHGKDGKPVPLLAQMDLRLPAAPTAPAAPVQPSRDEPLTIPPEWLDGEEPPEDGLAPLGSGTDDDSPEGAAKPLPPSGGVQAGRSHNSETSRSHISRDEAPRGETQGLISGATRTAAMRPEVSRQRGSQVSQQRSETPPRVRLAAETNTARGDETSRRVKEYETAYPGAKVTQICEALDLSKATVMRARKKLREQEA